MEPSSSDALNPTYIVPISGIDFVRYIAFYSALSRTPLRPAVILAASGGCMVSYMAMMSDFEASVESWRISSDMFAYKPIVVVPRLVSFLLTGSLYKRPNIDKHIFDSFAPSKLTNVEIITGYYGMKAGKITLSSNRNQASSQLNEAAFDLTLANVEHNDGRFEPILRSIEATTNIPFLLPAIGEHQLVDYGIHSPSPLTFARNGPLLRKVVYFAPADITKSSASGTRNLMFLNTIHTEIARLSAGFTKREEFAFSDGLDFVGKVLGLESYLLVVYAAAEVDLSITDFRWQQAQDVARNLKQRTRFRLYS